MSIERTTESTSLIDVLDRVVDRGIVIDAWVSVSLAGLEFLTIDARVVVASIETYLDRNDALSSAALFWPSHESRRGQS